MCMDVLPACMSLCISSMPGAQKGQRNLIRFYGTGVTDGCEELCGSWKWNPGPLERQPVLLIIKPSLQPPPVPFKIRFMWGGKQYLEEVCNLIKR